MKAMGRNFIRRNREADELFRIFYKAFSEVEDREIKEVLGEIFRNVIDKIKRILGKGVGRNGAGDKKLEMASIVLWGLG